MPGTISNQKALIYVMVLMSGVEGTMGDNEMQEIGHIVTSLPAFKNFDIEQLTTVARECGDMLQETDGFETVLALISDQLPLKLRETAYALAVEVAASDMVVGREELRFLAILRDKLGLDKLVTAALERSAIARYQTL